MNIKTVSKITEDAFITYTRCGMFFMNPLVSLLVYAIVSLGIMGIVIAGDVMGTDGYSDTFVYAGMIALVTALLLYMYFLLPRSRWKRVAKTPKGETHLTFLDKSVHVATYIGGERRREASCGYSDFERFKETKKYFFIFVGKNQALIIDKSRLSGGTPEQLRLKLREYKSVRYTYLAM